MYHTKYISPARYFKRLDSRHAVGVALVLLYALGMAFKGTFAKLIYMQGVGVMPVLFWRFMLSMPLFWGYGIYKLGMRELLAINVKDLCYSLAAGVFGFYIFIYADYEGLSLIGVNLERVLLFTYPLFVMLIGAAIQRKNPARAQWLALLVVQCGMAVMLLPDVLRMTGNMAGELWVLAAAVFHAVYVLCAGRIAPRIGSLKFTTYAMTACFFAIVIQTVCTQPMEALALDTLSLRYMLLMVVFSTWLPTFFFAEGIARIGANRAAIISVVGPFLTAGIAGLLLGEQLTAREAVAGFIIIAGIVLLERLPGQETRKKAQKNIFYRDRGFALAR